MCLSGATQQILREEKTPDVSLVFGGIRKDPDYRRKHPNPNWKHPLHACPAMDMANGAMLGIMAALFDAINCGNVDWPDGLTLTDGPQLEVYGEGFDPVAASGHVEIWVPVARRQ